MCLGAIVNNQTFWPFNKTDLQAHILSDEANVALTHAVCACQKTNRV